MKILIISLAGIGDTLCATPLIAELRKKFPKAQIDTLVMWSGSKDILKNNPYINKIYHFNLLKSPFKGIFNCLKLRRAHYNISINTYPQSRIEYRLIAYLIGAKQRLSHNYENKTILDKVLITSKINEDYKIHFIDNNLNFLNNLGLKPMLKNHNYQIFLDKEEINFAKKFIKMNNLKNKNIFGIQVGSGTTKNLALRRWPIENYKEVIEYFLTKRRKNVVLLFGGLEEAKDNDYLKRKINNDRLINVKTKNIMESAALVKYCNYFLSIDNSMMHIAAAMNVKNQILIETPTFNKTVEPYKRKFILIKNLLVHGKNLRYYRYNGKGIKGTTKEIKNIMGSVKPEQVYKKIK